MAQQSIFDVPAIVAGVPQVRSFSRGFGNYPRPYRKALQVYNRSSTTLIVTLNDGTSSVKRVASGDLLIYDEDTQISSYLIDAVANTNANEVQVFEDGGLDEA